jgi:hypothetical protein
MEKIELLTKFTRDGKLIPIEFTVNDKQIQVLDVGRSWDSEDGKHILVMDTQNQTHHLYFQLEDLSWYLVLDIKPSKQST